MPSHTKAIGIHRGIEALAQVLDLPRPEEQGKPWLRDYWEAPLYAPGRPNLPGSAEFEELSATGRQR